MNKEEIREELYRAGEVTSKISDKRKVHGERMHLPLSGRDIEVIYYPAADKPETRPVVFGMHGGGFVVGGCAFDDVMWDRMREVWRCNVISIGYRKAPQFAYPAALDDVYDAMDYCLHKMDALAFDRSQVYVFGNSAGSTLASQVTLRILARKEWTLSGVLLDYPYVDLATSPVEKGADEAETMESEVFAEAFLQGQDATRAEISPIFATQEQLAGFPCTYISVCENDTLRAEGETFGAKLKAAGVEVKMHLAKGMPHAYFEYAYGQESAQEPKDIQRMRKDGTLIKQAEEAMAFFAGIFRRL